jgi:hypothetical protein
MQIHKDVEIGEKRYRIQRFKSDDGSFIVFQLMTKMLPGFVAGQLNMAGLAQSGASMSEADFRTIQRHCLSVCYRYEGNSTVTEVPLPVMTTNGVFAIKDLEYDLATVLALTIHALTYNFSDFFQGNALSALASLQGLNS